MIGEAYTAPSSLVRWAVSRPEAAGMVVLTPLRSGFPWYCGQSGADGSVPPVGLADPVPADPVPADPVPPGAETGGAPRAPALAPGPPAARTPPRPSAPRPSREIPSPSAPS